MSKKQLQSIINDYNFFAGFQKKPEMDINSLTLANANELYERIDMGLSPENLHCDGEITRTQAMAKYRNYMGAVRELQKMGFDVPKECYEIDA